MIISVVIDVFVKEELMFFTKDTTTCVYVLAFLLVVLVLVLVKTLARGGMVRIVR